MTLGVLLRKLRGGNFNNYKGEKYLVCIECARLIKMENIDEPCPKCSSFNRILIEVL